MNMNDINCIFCNIDSKHIVIEENGYKGKKCPKCGLIYISPRPSFGEVVDLYGHNDAYVSAESHLSADFIKRLFARHNLRLIRSFIQNGELLEIGAGAGYFLDEARKVGFNPHGLEFNPIQSKYMRNSLNIPCEESPLNTSIFQGKKFDVVYLCDVVSHFFDPVSDFKTINELMKDDAFLIFETGNLGEVTQGYFKYFQRFQYPDHLFFFNTDNLIELLKKSGFDFIKIHRYSILPQLKVEKALSVIRKNHVSVSKVKQNPLPKKDDADIEFSARSMPLDTESFVKKGIKNTYRYFSYVLRYKIGRVAPKTNRPQTVIVIARKSKRGYALGNDQLIGSHT